MFLLCEIEYARPRHQTVSVAVRTMKRLLKDVKENTQIEKHKPCHFYAFVSTERRQLPEFGGRCGRGPGELRRINWDVRLHLGQLSCGLTVSPGCSPPERHL